MQLAHWLLRSTWATACRSAGLVQIFSDFDGTITIGDATDIVLDRFADPAWRLVEEEWQSGSIGSQECLARQIALMRCSPAEFDAAVDEIEIDPFFPRFVKFCRSRQRPLTIVSDGLDRVVFGLLRKAGLSPMRVYANRLINDPHTAFTDRLHDAVRTDIRARRKGGIGRGLRKHDRPVDKARRVLMRLEQRADLGQ